MSFPSTASWVAALCLTGLIACGGNVGGDDGAGAGGSGGSAAGAGGKSSAGGTGTGGKTSAGGTGSGGTPPGAGGASGSSGSAGTGGFPASCGPGIENCCRGVCSIAASKGCPNGPKTPDECECKFVNATDACAVALLRTYECLSANSNDIAFCDENGDTVLACGVCDEQFAALGNACGGELRCTFR